MKKFFFLIFIPLILSATPTWFFQVDYNKHETIGYGMASSLSLAKQNAIADIAQSISVNVETSTEVVMSDDNGEIHKHSLSDLKAQSKAILNGVCFIKVEELKGIWYVAARYDNSPIEVKFKKLLGNIEHEDIQNDYLKNTSLINLFNTTIEHTLNYRLIRKDNLWQLQYDDVILPLSQKEFYKLFSNQESNKITISANKYKYQPGDEIYFMVEHLEKGYISILYVEYNGKVGILCKNIYSTGKLRHPEIENESSYEINNPYGRPIKELYVAIYSKKPIKFYEFENVTESLMDNSNYNFDSLIKKLHSQTFSTFQIKIAK